MPPKHNKSKGKLDAGEPKHVSAQKKVPGKRLESEEWVSNAKKKIRKVCGPTPTGLATNPIVTPSDNNVSVGFQKTAKRILFDDSGSDYSTVSSALDVKSPEVAEKKPSKTRMKNPVVSLML